MAQTGGGAFIRLGLEHAGALQAHGFIDQQAEAFGKGAGALFREQLQNGVQEFRFGRVGHLILHVVCFCRHPNREPVFPSAQLNGININHSTESSQGKHNHKIAIDINTYPKKKVTGILNKQLIDPCVEQNCDKDIEERAKEIMKIEKDEADGQKEETQEQKEQTARQENEKVLL